MSQLTVTAELARYGPHAAAARPPSYAEALDYCRRLARSHYENFAVVSPLLPRALRPHFYAIYAYCRWADDLADESARSGDKLWLLAWWEHELDRCYAGDVEHPVFVALRETIREYSIPRQPLADLLTAFRQDQAVRRYATAGDVLAYCRNSAQPVGRLILYLGRCHDARRGELSDSICTGLQLANFCQDVARDWDIGRVYLPQSTLDAAGYTEAMFARRECNEAFRRALGEEVDRAERYLRAGAPLVGLMPPALRLQVALFVGGGLEILAAIRRQDYDVWRTRPRVSRWTQLRLLARSWWHVRRLPYAEAET
jgi:squalene synthase HpnC